MVQVRTRARAGPRDRADRLRETAYWVSQGARTAWFLGEYVLGRRRALTGEAGRRGPLVPKALLGLLADVRALQRRDLANVAAGYYGLPDDLATAPLGWLADARAYFADLPAVVARRRRGGGAEVRGRPDAAGLPAYYLHNFHYQTDGYLSARSARLYDHQVEVLFLGAADAMRRQALVPIGDWLRGRRSAAARLLDVGCGTGRFLEIVAATYPRMPVLALDLSAPYLDAAARRLSRFSRARAVRGLAEALPFADASVDLATCVYLLHEVPGGVRLAIAAELARVLRPGGRLVLVDSIQPGDVPAYDPMIEAFPATFHEPYYADYARTDLAALFAGAGLRPAGRQRAFLSTVVSFDKP